MKSDANEIFDRRRFGMLVKMNLKSGLSKSRMVAVVLLAVYLLVAVWHYLSGSVLTSPDRNAYILALSMIFAFYLPSGLYGFVTDEKKGIGNMLLPASSFEKYLSMAVVATLSLPLLFYIVLYGLDNLLAMLSATGNGLSGPSVGIGAYSLGDIASDFLNIILFQSMFVFGNVVFRKKKVAATLLTAVGVHIVLFALLRLSGISVETFMATRKHLFAALFLLYKYCIPITLYVWGYIKFKKIELA